MTTQTVPAASPVTAADYATIILTAEGYDPDKIAIILDQMRPELEDVYGRALDGIRELLQSTVTYGLAIGGAAIIRVDGSYWRTNPDDQAPALGGRLTVEEAARAVSSGTHIPGQPGGEELDEMVQANPQWRVKVPGETPDRDQTFGWWRARYARPLVRLGRALTAAGTVEDKVRDALYVAIREAVAEGMPEAEAARLAGVDRMTVRRVLGKR